MRDKHIKCISLGRAIKSGFEVITGGSRPASPCDQLFYAGSYLNPWWQFEFRASVKIHEVHIRSIYTVLSERLIDFSIFVSDDGVSWSHLFTADKNDTGGNLVPGGPYIWDGPERPVCRFTRVMLLGYRDKFAIRDIIVFGEFVDRPHEHQPADLTPPLVANGGAPQFQEPSATRVVNASWGVCP
jgi:hypothetical protein